MISLQKVTEIEEKVAELKERVHGIMKVVVNDIARKNPRDLPQDLLNDLNQLASSVLCENLDTECGF